MCISVERVLWVNCKLKVVQAAIIIFLNKIFYTTPKVCSAFELSFSLVTYFNTSKQLCLPSCKQPLTCLFRRLEKCNLNIKPALHKVKGLLNVLILFSWRGQFYMSTFNAYNFLLLYL